ncbi:MAG: T9SS type A sorting domain-containing protein, partial [Candidatus Marinimicrobia bacterium]|nr:T9SS type A sorting domain-containing protein [Candidatus Neomarinimicrobiota bacterium]
AGCDGVCFSGAVEDDCATCDDDPSNDCVQDCMGDWGGLAIYDILGTCGYEEDFDDCGILDGGNLEMDCNGECFGTGLLDECATCDSDPSNDCVQDCLGDWGGFAILDVNGTCGYVEDFDECGVLAGDNLDMDCSGECFGTALLDECDTCDSDPSNDCIQDCLGDWGGFAILDVNGTCGYEEDFDECGILDGGNLEMDCNGECFGTAYDDMCGNCVEGSTGFVPCTGQADLYFGDIDYQNQTIEIRLNNGAPVYGFQFQIFGDTEIINLGNPSGGSAENANYMVSLGGENIVLGYSLFADAIPSGDEVLTTLSFEGCGLTEMCITNPEIVGVGPSILPVDIGECITFALTSAGDVNYDCSVDVSDIIFIVDSYLSNSGYTEFQLMSGDVNQDGNIDIVDLIIIIGIILDQDLSRIDPVVFADISMNGNQLNIKSEGSIAAVELDISGEFQIEESLLPSGWQVFTTGGKILMISMDSATLENGKMIRFNNQPVINSAVIYDWFGTRTNATISVTPQTYFLSDAYPNPFNPVTTLNFGLPEDAYVKIVIYDMLGQEVALLEEGVLSAGNHQVFWNAGNQPSGMYIVRMNTGDFSNVRKILLLK